MATERPLVTASWASHEDVVTRYRYKPGALWLGRSPTNEATPLGFDDDRHVLLVSGTRGGKGTTFIVPNLIRWLGSVVVVDPKAENATLTAATRARGSKYCPGQAVHVLDPFREARVPEALRSRFNPLDAIDPTHPEAVDLAVMIASAMIVMGEGESKTWDEDALDLLQGLILHVKTAKEFEGRRNLLTVRALLMKGDEETVDLLKQGGETGIASAQALLWEALRDNPACDGVISAIGAAIGELYATAPKQFQGVLSSAKRNTKFLDSPGIQACVESSNFSLSELKTDPNGLSLYLSLPTRYHKTHFRWLRMMIDLTVSQLEATRGRPACGHRVLMCLDEFAGLRRMESIEDAVAKIAGFGVKLLFAVQDLGQLKAVYKDNWQTFYTNCGCAIFFSFRDPFTAEHVSKVMGEEEVIRPVHSKTDTETTQTSVGHTDSYQLGTSFQMNESEAEQRGEADTIQENEALQRSVADQKGRTRGWNASLNFGRGKGEVYKPGFIFDEEENRTRGKNRNFGGGIQRSKSESQTITNGTTLGKGNSHTVNGSTTKTKGVTAGIQESRGSSDSKQESKGNSHASSIAETVHKRPLQTIDELTRNFARVVDKEHLAYPGLALVLLAEELPIWIRKAHYYEDHEFIGGFDPHPDYRYTPLVESTISITVPPPGIVREMEREGSQPFHVTRWLAEPGTFLQAGAKLAEIAGDTLGYRTSTLHAPVHGWVSEIHVPRDKHGFAVGHYGLRDTQLVTMTSYESTYLVRQAHAELPQNFLASIQQAQQALEQQRAAERQRQLAEIEERKRQEAERGRAKAEAARVADLQRQFREIVDENKSVLDEYKRLKLEHDRLASAEVLALDGLEGLEIKWRWVLWVMWVLSAVGVYRVLKKWDDFPRLRKGCLDRLNDLFPLEERGAELKKLVAGWQANCSVDYPDPWNVTFLCLGFLAFIGFMEWWAYSTRKNHARVSILYESVANKARPVIEQLDRINAKLPWNKQLIY
jgi:type IV secretory pathway TraG/TraD family ATPase VirD4